MTEKLKLPKYFHKNATRIEGIYFCIQNGKIVYIGQSVDCLIRPRFSGMWSFKYDFVRIIQCKGKRKRLKYEKRWIQRFQPKYNKAHRFKWIGPQGWTESGKTRKRRVPVVVGHVAQNAILKVA